MVHQLRLKTAPPITQTLCNTPRSLSSTAIFHNSDGFYIDLSLTTFVFLSCASFSACFLASCSFATCSSIAFIKSVAFARLRADYSSCPYEQASDPRISSDAIFHLCTVSQAKLSFMNDSEFSCASISFPGSNSITASIARDVSLNLKYKVFFSCLATFLQVPTPAFDTQCFQLGGPARLIRESPRFHSGRHSSFLYLQDLLHEVLVLFSSINLLVS